VNEEAMAHWGAVAPKTNKTSSFLTTKLFLQSSLLLKNELTLPPVHSKLVAPDLQRPKAMRQTSSLPSAANGILLALSAILHTPNQTHTIFN